MSIFSQQLRHRYAALGVILLVVFGILLIRLWSVQVLAGDTFAEAAEENRVREIVVDAPRGRILDRDGVPLALNRSTLGVTVSPAARDDEELLVRLSATLGLPHEVVMERALSQREAFLDPRLVAHDVSMSVAAYLAEHEQEYPGVEVVVVPVREYPHGTLAAHVLGYTGEISQEQLQQPEFAAYIYGDIVGRAGLELQYESVLQGVKGFERVEVDARGTPRRIIESAEPVPGSDIVLTIDIDTQRVAEQALVDAIARARSGEFPNASAGSAVVLDVRTGEVLAMASVPTFDPSVFTGGIPLQEWARLTAEGSGYPLNNRAIQALYPPASTFKALTGLAALEMGLASTGRVNVCDGEWTGMGEEWAKYCWDRGGHGSLDFEGGMANSCQTVFYEIGYEFDQRGREEIQEWSRRFGLGSTLGLDLPGELSGRVPDAAWKAEFNRDFPEYREWLPGDTVNIAVGQGDLLATPLQVTALFAGLANDGTIKRPHLLKQVLDGEGRPIRSVEPTVQFESRASARSLSRIRESLVAATAWGTGESAFRGFEAAVAGKTGTAQVAGRDNYAWFAAYAPADDPRYAVGVVIEEGGSGGAIAAPAARTILAQLLEPPSGRVTATDHSR